MKHYAHVVSKAERDASERLSEKIAAQLEPEGVLEPNLSAKA